MGLFDFVKGLIKKQEGNSYNDESKDNKYEGLNIKELYLKGKGHWLDGEFEEALEYFKWGINEQDQQDPYSYACLAMYYYQIASAGSERGEAEEYNKVVSWAGSHVRESSKSDMLALYCLGDVAAKLGTAEESISEINPLYKSLYRYLGLLLYNYISSSQKELTEKIDEFEEVPIFEKQMSLMNSEQRMAKSLSESQKEELIQIKKGNLTEGGLIEHLVLDIHNYPKSEFKQLQKSIMNQNNVLLPMVLFCSLVSEARLKGSKGQQ